MHDLSSENHPAATTPSELNAHSGSATSCEPASHALPLANNSVCCNWLSAKTLQRFAIATLVIVAATATYAAAYFAEMAQQANANIEAAHAAAADADDVLANWEGLPIANAAAAVSSEKFSVCTGLISEESEALFVLDHNSGLLQCSVLYPRLGRFMATYTINVADALGMEAKGGSYIMVTGTADFPSSSNRPLGFSVVYVLDTASGNYACYGVPFDRVAMKSNRPQQGVMFLIGQGSANPVIDRDDLR
ncbi:hypothetical protein [Rhodopirellula sallentina]|uniref:Uncharacterized protein n=1 Tax=Rhodopirellula sallentina SM41 TaxID=1263870 RepID=M5TWX9_9BACT|nr:hypothetical protein [Rhodopirellula sallentina]EMI53554.1 hypothetical protein RSSM_05010 [Rhodopirellula sallentina SM41]